MKRMNKALHRLLDKLTVYFDEKNSKYVMYDPKKNELFLVASVGPIARSGHPATVSEEVTGKVIRKDCYLIGRF